MSVLLTAHDNFHLRVELLDPLRALDAGVISRRLIEKHHSWTVEFFEQCLVVVYSFIIML